MRGFFLPQKINFWNFLVLIFFVLWVNIAYAGPPKVALYGLYETTVDYQTLKGVSHAYLDPFYGIDLEATFTSPSGKTVTWWGFFDGDGMGGQSGNIWKIRFMPDELGPWNFTWKFNDNSLSGSGSFQAVNNLIHPEKLGPLKHDANIPQWFVTADESKHVFLNMYQDDTSFPDIFAAHDQYLNPQKHIDKLKANGFDVIFTDGGIHPTNRVTMPMDGNNPYPYTDATSFVPRLQGWHHMEDGLWQKAYDQNIFVHEFWGFYGGNGKYHLHKKSLSFQNKVIKYWLSRTAPYYIFLYNIGFELPEYVSVPSWPAERAQFIKSIDPWDHLITGHELHGWSYGNTSVIDFSTLQNDDNFHQRGLNVWNSASKPHPHCNECIWNAQWQAPGTESSHRKDLWDGITAGMSYGFFSRDSDIGLISFKHANTFLKNGVKWWTMSPHDETVVSGTPYVLAKLGSEYIAYSFSGGSFGLNISTGRYKKRWFNPATGKYKSWSILEAVTGTPTKFCKPSPSDWVLQVISQEIVGSEDTTPPRAPCGLKTE